jgi:hypothetical protein
MTAVNLYETAPDPPNHVHERWRNREAPDGDFIVYSDGSLSVMSLLRLRAHDKRHDPWSEAWHWSEILRATAWRASDWLDVDATMASSGHAGYRALAGESASHGSVGWVALTLDDEQHTLQWLAVACSSNPFAEVTLDEATVTATSTLGRVWAFPRESPHLVAITADPDYPWPRTVGER